MPIGDASARATSAVGPVLQFLRFVISGRKSNERVERKRKGWKNRESFIPEVETACNGKLWLARAGAGWRGLARAGGSGAGGGHLYLST